MTNSPQILIFEPNAAGHEMGYVRYILTEIDRMIDNPRIILLTTTETAQHPNTRRVANEFGHFVTIRIAPLVSTRGGFFAALGVFVERQWRQAEQLQRGLTEIGIDCVDFILVPHLSRSAYCK